MGFRWPCPPPQSNKAGGIFVDESLSVRIRHDPLCSPIGRGGVFVAQPHPPPHRFPMECEHILSPTPPRPPCRNEREGNKSPNNCPSSLQTKVRGSSQRTHSFPNEL